MPGFGADYAKRPSNCKKCKEPIPKESLRLAKLAPNPFHEGAGDMKSYFHPPCLFETFAKARATTKTIDEPADDIDGWENLKASDKSAILQLVEGCSKKSKTLKKMDDFVTKKAVDHSPKPSIIDKEKTEKTLKKMNDFITKKAVDNSPTPSIDKEKTEKMQKAGHVSKMDSFMEFCKLCERIAAVPKHTDKSAEIKKFINQDVSDGSLLLLFKFLLPLVDPRIFNLKEKQLIKLLANIFDFDADELSGDYNQSGDLSITIRKKLEEKSSRKNIGSQLTLHEVEEKSLRKNIGSQLTLHEVEKWLDDLAGETHMADQQRLLQLMTHRTSPFEFHYLLRLIKKDLRFNAGAKNILDGLHPAAYQAFQNSRNLSAVVQQFSTPGSSPETTTSSVGISVGTPVRPMLAEPCKSTEQAMKRCPNGCIVEVKFDGERLQCHKRDKKFDFFTRSMKAPVAHKIEDIEESISRAFPEGGDMILDGELLLVDTNTGKPLPFGTLGVHKKAKFATTSVCLFVFDCLLFQGKSLMNEPIMKRKEILVEHMVEIPHRILLSKWELVKNGETEKLKSLIQSAIDDGLEGLMLKDTKSPYEPGKRHWLKVKKDYLVEEGHMADSADLLVLGAYYGTGNKGGMMSVFLMGLRDPISQRYFTVCKCGNGHDDAMLEKLNRQLASQMKKIGRDYKQLPEWLDCPRSLVPDFVIDDPKMAPIWEITGAEFSKADKHTAAGISIRFPRVTRIREDKNWETATNLSELKNLYEISKMKSDFNQPTTSKQNPFWTMKAEIAKEKRLETMAKLERKHKLETEDFDDDEDEDKEDEGKTIANSHKKVPCRYGASCYRRNPQHLEEFTHPPRPTR